MCEMTKESGLNSLERLSQGNGDVPIVSEVKLHFMAEMENLFLKIDEFVIDVDKNEVV